MHNAVEQFVLVAGIATMIAGTIFIVGLLAWFASYLCWKRCRDLYAWKYVFAAIREYKKTHPVDTA